MKIGGKYKGNSEESMQKRQKKPEGKPSGEVEISFFYFNAYLFSSHHLH